MTKKLFLITILLILVCLGFWRGAGQNEGRHREKIWSQWLNSAQRLAKSTRNSKAYELLGFITAHAALAESSQIPENSGKASIAVIPILPGDQIIPDLQKYSKNVAYFAHGQGFRAVFLNRHQSTPHWKGIILLHEFHHAYNSYKNSGNTADTEAEEYHIIQFDIQLMRSLGGSLYKKYLNQEIERLKREMQVSKKYGLIIPVWLSEYPGLDQIFGPALSNAEKDVRRMRFYLDACFEVIDGYLRKSSDKAKLVHARMTFRLAEAVEASEPPP